MKWLCNLIGHSKKYNGHTVLKGTINCRRCGQSINISKETVREKRMKNNRNR